MVAFLCNCINMLEKQFPYFREKRRIKQEIHQQLTFDINKRLSKIPNSFKIRKLISHRVMADIPNVSDRTVGVISYN